MEPNNKMSKTININTTVQQSNSSLVCTNGNHQMTTVLQYDIQNLQNALKDKITENVFGNELLLEKILTYAIHTAAGVLDPKLVQKVRSVQKSWLQATTKLLDKLKTSVIKLKLTDSNSLNKMDVVKEKGKLLNRFTQTFTTNEGIVESAMPFKLTLTTTFFRKENYDSLVDCLTRLGSHLFELEITYPEDGGTLPVILPNIRLPSLGKLLFQFSHETLLSDEEEDVKTFGNNARGMWLLCFILNSAENLKEFELPFNINESKIPEDFEFLRLPQTILDLDFNMRMTSDAVKVLIKNNLPILKHFTLLLHQTPLEDDLLYQVLKKVQNTLTTFDIDGLVNAGTPRAHTHLRFPVMKQLHSVAINSTECVLGPGDVIDLQECLPNLVLVELNYQTEENFKKWTDKNTFGNVKDLTVSIADENCNDYDDNYYISLDMELIKTMDRGFPNLQKLRLVFNVNSTSGLSYLFHKMTKLVTLRIDFKGNLKDYSSDLLNSAFLGLPIIIVTGLREHRDLIEKAEFKDAPSIRNLSGLTTLGLFTAAIPEDKEGSLLSPVLFDRGLLKMPKLKRLQLVGEFKPTPEISKLWMDYGGEIIDHD